MDKFDARILQVLKKQGRISNVDLANQVGLSASATLRRVQTLEQQQVIQGYQAVLNREQLGIGFIAYVAIGLSAHTKTAQLDFEAHISESPEVIECHSITGQYEYLLRIETSNLASYKIFHAHVLGACEWVQSIETQVVMSSPKDER